VLVATIRAIKHQGNYDNLDRHIANIKTHYNLPCVVAINRFKDDDCVLITLGAGPLSTKIRSVVSSLGL
jgi:formyltetrahydrofolate synthetase